MAYMWAYGSNLHVGQMARRCPAAILVGRLRRKDWRLVFRGVADVIPEPGAVCYGGLWDITEECERALDIYEGVGSGLYDKIWAPIRLDGVETEMLFYRMRSTGVFPPSRSYLDVIRQGYLHFRMPKAATTLLRAAVADSWDDKHPSNIERRRHARKGRPSLAPRPDLPLPATTR
jgi:hypothetical protein